MTVQFKSVHSLYESFSVLWSNKKITKRVEEKVTALEKRYAKDLRNELTDEFKNFKWIYSADFSEKTL